MAKQILTIYFPSIVLFVIITNHLSFANLNNANELPKFYFTSKMTQCPIDSPELYYEDIGLAMFSTAVQESRVFFGVLMDKLESALGESDEYEDKLQENWEDFTKLMSNNFDEKSKRIGRMWDKVITIYEIKTLPWETRLHKVVIFEIFCGLHYEYLLLEALMKSGVKEIVSTLQGTFGKAIRKLGETMLNQGEGDTAEMFKKAEEVLLEVEPNFVGRLLSRMLKNGRKLKERMEKGLPTTRVETFLTEPVQQIGILVEAYNEKIKEYPTSFWREMTNIMKNGTGIPTGDELYLQYSRNEEKLIVNILNLLSSPLGKGHT